MKSSKFVVPLFTVLFLLGLTGISNAFPIFNEVIYEIEIKKFEYISPDDYKLNFKGIMDYQPIDPTIDAVGEWEFELEREDNKFKKKEWKLNTKLDKKITEKGVFSDFEIKTTGDGFFEFNGMFIVDATDELLYSTAGNQLYLSGVFISNSPIFVFPATLSNNMGQVPEPSTMLLLGMGLIGLSGLGRKKFLKRKHRLKRKGQDERTKENIDQSKEHHPEMVLTPGD